MFRRQSCNNILRDLTVFVHAFLACMITLDSKAADLLDSPYGGIVLQREDFIRGPDRSLSPYQM